MNGALIVEFEDVITEANRIGFESAHFTFELVNIRVWGVPKNISRSSYRDDLLSFVRGDRDSSQIVQIVGDCYPFNVPAALGVEEMLRARLKTDEESLFLWGFTGCPPPGRDLNQIVNDLIDEDPEVRWPRCFANVVDFGTMRALTDWGCRTPIRPARQKVFILVTGNADFGDDMDVSDGITDELLVFEGGLQCFMQIVNCLERGCEIKVLSDLRNLDEAPRFSASRLVLLLLNRGDVPPKTVKDDYLNSLAVHLSSKDIEKFNTAWECLEPQIQKLDSLVKRMLFSYSPLTIACYRNSGFGSSFQGYSIILFAIISSDFNP
jgi:hypothetical protein